MSKAEAKRQKKRYTLFTGKQLFWLIAPLVVESIFYTYLGLLENKIF